MSYTQTPNYNLFKPTVNADNNLWGDHLNANSDTIDTQLKTVDTKAGGASSTTPVMDGTAAVGAGTTWARSDHVHPVDTSRYAAANPSGYQTAAQVTTAVASALNNVGRNLLHNPLFNVAQRGAGPWGVAGYTLDRWLIGLTTDTVNVNQFALTDTARAQIGDEAARYGIQNTFVGSAAAGAYDFLEQRIEGVNRLTNKTVTISFYANASASLRLGVSLDQVFGTGGSPSAAVLLNGQSVTVTTTWTRFSVTLTLPSVAGKTLGTAGDDATFVNFWFSSGATQNVRSGSVGVQSGTIQLWGVQLEIGSAMTPLEKPDPQQDIAKCQRFFSQQAFFLSAYGANAATFGGSITFPVTMRASPTVVFTGSTTPTNATAQTIGQVNNNSCIVYATASSSAFTQINTTLSASADL